MRKRNVLNVSLWIGLSWFVPVSASTLGYVEHNESSSVTLDVIVSNEGKHVYSLALGNSSLNEANRINVFSRHEETGALALNHRFMSDDSFDTSYSFSPDGLVISPDGKQIYVTAEFGKIGSSMPYGSSILTLSRDVVSGELTYQSRLLSGTDFNGLNNPSGSLAITDDGKFLYAGEIGGQGAIVIFRRDEHGQLSHVETVINDQFSDALESHIKVHLSPDNDNLYATTTQGVLYVFTRDVETGRLTTQQTFKDSDQYELDPDGIKIQGLSKLEHLVVSEDGLYAYTLGLIDGDKNNSGDDRYAITIFRRDGISGHLTFVKHITNTVAAHGKADWDTLWWPVDAKLSHDDNQQFLYVGSQIADAINVFKRDVASGDLTWVGWEEDRTGVPLNDVQKLVLSQDGRHLYTALETGRGVSVFDLRSDLGIVKKDSRDPVAKGDAFSYELTVSNQGPSDASHVVVTDTLPEGVSFKAIGLGNVNGACQQLDRDTRCDVPLLPVGSSFTVRIDVTAEQVDKTVRNNAAVAADQLDTDTQNNEDTELTVIGSPSASSGSSGGGGAWFGFSTLGLLLMHWLRRRTSRYCV